MVRTRGPILNTARLDFRDYLFNTVLRDNRAELVPQFVSCLVWATPNVNELAVIARRFVCRVFEIKMKPMSMYSFRRFRPRRFSSEGVIASLNIIL